MGASPFVTVVYTVSCSVHSDPYELNLNYKKMNHTMRVLKRFRIIQAFGSKVGSKVKI